MTEKENGESYSIKPIEVQKVIDVARSLLLPFEPIVVDTSDINEGDEAIGVHLGTPKIWYQVEESVISVAESHMDEIIFIDVEISSCQHVEGEIKPFKRIYTIYPNDMTIEYMQQSEQNETDDSAIAAIQNDDFNEMIKEMVGVFKMRSEFKRIIGEYDLTRDRFEKLIQLLEQCNPENQIEHK